MVGIELLGLIAGGLSALGAAEVIAHRRNLERIPTRIHISGTRGKSSVTRLIAGALRHSGRRTVAKTTGTLARMILPDGREIPMFRPAGANIIEQTRVVRVAAEAGAQDLVIECMALQPSYHWLSENKLVRATHGVITNARADHLDVMGPTEEDVALCLAGMIPVKGVLFTAERRHVAILQAACDDRGTQLIGVTDEDLAAVTDEELSHFVYAEHRENVALVLKLTDALGVPRQTALEGMWAGQPDPGALLSYPLDFFGRRIVFVNGFAANDPESTEKVWNLARGRHSDCERVVAVFNMRADRPARTLQMARETSFWHPAAAVVLMGSGAYLFGRMAGRAGLDPARFVYADSERADDIFEELLGVCGSKTLVIGMGNIGGPGLELVRYIRNRAVLPATEEDL